MKLQREFQEAECNYPLWTLAWTGGLNSAVLCPPDRTCQHICDRHRQEYEEGVWSLVCFQCPIFGLHRSPIPMSPQTGTVLNVPPFMSYYYPLECFLEEARYKYPVMALRATVSQLS